MILLFSSHYLLFSVVICCNFDRCIFSLCYNYLKFPIPNICIKLKLLLSDKKNLIKVTCMKIDCEFFCKHKILLFMKSISSGDILQKQTVIGVILRKTVQLNLSRNLHLASCSKTFHLLTSGSHSSELRATAP